MTAKEFLIEKWNSCIWMTHEDYPGNIVMIYDKHFIRQKKLQSLSNDNDDITFNKTSESKVLFYQDYKNDYLSCDYSEIWSILESKYRLKYNDIQLLIKEVLLEYNKLKQLTSVFGINPVILELLEYNKLKQLTPEYHYRILRQSLLEDNKLKQLTHQKHALNYVVKLLEDNKLKKYD